MKDDQKAENVVTIGPKHQVVIPKAIRRQYGIFKTGTKVHVYPLDEKTLALKIEDGNWAHTEYGALKDVWEDIDVDKEIKKMKDEWD